MGFYAVVADLKKNIYIYPSNKADIITIHIPKYIQASSNLWEYETKAYPYIRSTVVEGDRNTHWITPTVFSCFLIISS